MSKPDSPFRLTRSSRRVLLVLLTGAGRLSGYPIIKAARVRPARVSAILGDLERAGWVAADWEHGVPTGEARRFYQLTRYGRAEAMRLLGLEGGHA